MCDGVASRFLKDFPMQSTNFTDYYKGPEQMAEATRQAVRETADGADAYSAGVGQAAEPSKRRARQLMDEFRSRGRQWREQGGRYVSDRPVRAMVMAAAGGAAVTTLMLAALRGSRR
jgi:ElaB/YqjD/DUF883 family membrane-anchored ribosome-binding protein